MKNLTLSVIANAATVFGAVSDSDFHQQIEGVEKRKQNRANKQKKPQHRKGNNI